MSRASNGTSDLDAQIAEEVMGENLTVNDDERFAVVAHKHIWVTGPVFETRDGYKIPMPTGKNLPDPSYSADYNERYFVYAGEVLCQKFPKLADEAKAFYRAPLPYSSDEGLTLKIVRRMWELGFSGNISATGHRGERVFSVRFAPSLSRPATGDHEDPSAATAVGMAALKAVRRERESA